MQFQLFLETEQGKLLLGDVDFQNAQTFHAFGATVTTSVSVGEGFQRMDIRTEGSMQGFFTVRCTYEQGEIYTFSGKQSEYGVFRQSPHDANDHVIDTPKEAVPMVAVKQDGKFTILFSDNPAVYDNYTTQAVVPQEKYCELSSGDGGAVSGGTLRFAKHFQTQPHFTVVLAESTADSLIAMRKDLFFAIDKAFGNGVFSKFHAVCFSSNYMHYRVNEIGSSKYWVVPGIDYCNKQYPRDAFWQSMIFPVAMEQQCYDGVYKGRYAYAENALIFLIWSYRLQKRGGKPDFDRMQDALAYIEKHVHDNAYTAGLYNGGYAFKSWYDLCSFEDDDVIAYNQGLFVTAMLCAKELGFTVAADIDKAKKKYNALFLKEQGYFPLSKKKPQVLCVDATVGDLLAYLLFGTTILDDASVASHYKTTFAAANTKYGAKITCRADGAYCTLEDYSAFGTHEPSLSKAIVGDYSWGGSYYLYEMLFHIDAYVHGVKAAEENMIIRSTLDFTIGGTYFEHINTVTGRGNKPNQGWNACIYPIWNTLIERGVANNKFFDKMNELL